jgi:epoxyqueuosine reductase
MMEACAGCSLCARACPTRCIPADRFLIHAENCLTFHNESPAVFPDGIRPEWHNALVGCMRCQLACPVNKARLRTAGGPIFSELETALLLRKPPMETLDDQTRLKLKTSEMDDYYEVLGRNLAVLLAK